MSKRLCFRCLRTPEQIGEYDGYAEEDRQTPTEFVRESEGTYNRATDTFCCTECYVAIGEPSRPSGWVAPAIGRDEAGSDSRILAILKEGGLA